MQCFGGSIWKVEGFNKSKILSEIMDNMKVNFT